MGSHMPVSAQGLLSLQVFEYGADSCVPEAVRRMWFGGRAVSLVLVTHQLGRSQP